MSSPFVILGIIIVIYVYVKVRKNNAESSPSFDEFLMSVLKNSHFGSNIKVSGLKWVKTIPYDGVEYSPSILSSSTNDLGSFEDCYLIYRVITNTNEIYYAVFLDLEELWSNPSIVDLIPESSIGKGDYKNIGWLLTCAEEQAASNNSQTKPNDF